MCVQSCAWMCLWETFLCWHYGDCSTAALCWWDIRAIVCLCVYVFFFFFFLWSELQHIEMHMNLPAWAWLWAFSVFGLYCFLFVCLYVSICKSWSSSPVLSLLVLPLLLLWLPNFSQLHQVVNSSCDHSFTLDFLFPGKTILCISFLQKQNRCSCRHNCIVFRRLILNVSHLHVKNKVTVIHELFFLCGVAIFLLNSLKLFMAFRLTLKALLARGFLEREEVTQHRWRFIMKCTVWRRVV